MVRCPTYAAKRSTEGCPFGQRSASLGPVGGILDGTSKDAAQSRPRMARNGVWILHWQASGGFGADFIRLKTAVARCA